MNKEIAIIGVNGKMGKWIAEYFHKMGFKVKGFDTNNEIIKPRLEVLVKIAKDIGLEFVEPDGAMYLFAKTKYKDFDATKFSEKLLEHGVAIAPGEGFGDYKEFFRITAIDETRLKEGMIILDTVLKESYE